MAQNKFYLAIGEETTRGTAEVSTVGFIPVNSATLPTYATVDEPRNEFRGEDTLLGTYSTRRESKSWTYDFDMPLYTEAGTVKNTVGTLFKHLFGSATSVQNASTGQYAHTMYPTDDYFGSSNIGTKALTVLPNHSEAGVTKYRPYVGGLVNKMSISQEIGQTCQVSTSLFGQYAGSNTSEIGSQTYAAQNLRCNYNNLKCYRGSITKTGTAPDYTDISFSSATQIFPYSVSIEISNGISPETRLEGTDYAKHAKFTGMFEVSVSMKFDFETPSSGFDSVAEWNKNFDDDIASTNLAFHWDTGTQAGSGDNHGLIIDIPNALLENGTSPDRQNNQDTVIDFNYKANYSASDAYLIAAILKNTATGV